MRGLVRYVQSWVTVTLYLTPKLHTPAVGSASLSYDANPVLSAAEGGNLTSDGSTTFTYDVENRLVAASGAKVAGLRYDPLGRLYETGGATANTRLLYDGDALVGEYGTGGALLRRYVHGLGADEVLAWYEGAAVDGSTRRHLYSNMQGSIVTVMDFSGAVLGINRYDEYGTPQSTNIGRFQYTGQAWIAELGLYYYKARMYSPTLGRFMQTDPIGYADGLGWYGYVGGDPVNRSDPSGLKAVWICDNADCSKGHWGDDGTGEADGPPITWEAAHGCYRKNGCYTGVWPGSINVTPIFRDPGYEPPLEALEPLPCEGSPCGPPPPPLPPPPLPCVGTPCRLPGDNRPVPEGPVARRKLTGCEALQLSQKALGLAGALGSFIPHPIAKAAVTAISVGELTLSFAEMRLCSK